MYLVSISEAYGTAKRIVATQGIETDNIKALFGMQSSFAAVEFGVYLRQVVLHLAHQ
jgi:hypothetical protein